MPLPTHIDQAVERETAATMLYHAGIDFTDFGERFGDRDTYQLDQIIEFTG